MSFSPSVLGKSIKEMRNRYNYTQASLSEEVGVTLEHLQKLEGGSKTPSVDLLYKLASILGFSIDAAFFPRENEKGDLQALLERKLLECTDFEAEVAINTALAAIDTMQKLRFHAESEAPS